MTLVLIHDLDIVKMCLSVCLCTENEVPSFSGSKVKSLNRLKERLCLEVDDHRQLTRGESRNPLLVTIDKYDSPVDQ